MLVLLILLHLYIGARILPDLGFGALGIVLGGALLALSALVIPLGFRSRRNAGSVRSRLPMWTGLIAMGAFSTLFVLTIVRDVALLVVLALNALEMAHLPIATIARDTAWLVPVAMVLAASRLLQTSAIIWNSYCLCWSRWAWVWF